MSQKKLQIDLPSDILLTLNESEDRLKQRITTLLAIQLYEEGKVTVGKASQIAGVSRLDFENLLAEKKISISTLELEDVMNDVQKLK
jgi:predicted HTH domain antitoxin